MDVEEMRTRKDVKGLVKALEDEDEDVRWEAVVALGKIGDSIAVEPLIKALQDEEENRHVRREAVVALGKIGDARAVETLIKALENKEEDNDVRREATVALGKIRDAGAVERLVKAMDDENEDEGIRWEAAVALGEMGDARAVELLIEALQDEDWDVQVRSAEVLGNLGDRRAVEPLTQILHEKDICGDAMRIKDTAEVALAMINRDKSDIQKGKCPICRADYKFWEGRKLKCRFCGANLKGEQKRLVEETFEEITESPEYEVVIPFAFGRYASLEWPACCCMCLKPVGFSDSLEVSTTRFERMEGYDKYFTEYKLKIPYCKDCRKKVKKIFGRPEKEGVSIIPPSALNPMLLKFRNPVYCSMLMQANKEVMREFREALEEEE